MKRPVVIGVGNRLRGDDAVGCVLIDRLADSGLAEFINAADSPENYIQPVVELGPAQILFVDACHFGGRPGEFRLFDRAAIEELSYGLMSTHTLPLNLTVEMLVQETGAKVQLLGVQPASMEFGQDLSLEVAKALPEIEGFVREWCRS